MYSDVCFASPNRVIFLNVEDRIEYWKAFVLILTFFKGNSTVSARYEQTLTLKYMKTKTVFLSNKTSSQQHKQFELRRNNTGMVVESICFTQACEEKKQEKNPLKSFYLFYLSTSSKNLISSLLILESIL